MPAVNGVGEPCAGEPHARFEAAGAGNGAPGMVTAVKRPAGETRGKVAAGPDAGQCHRASPRPYSDFPVSILCPNGTRDEGSAGGEAGFPGFAVVAGRSLVPGPGGRPVAAGAPACGYLPPVSSPVSGLLSAGRTKPRANSPAFTAAYRSLTFGMARTMRARSPAMNA